MKYLIIVALICASVSASQTTNMVQKESVKTAHKLAEKKGKWVVTPDYGEDDDKVVGREADLNEKGDKKSGWTNPLAKTDDGTDDHKVLP